MSDDRDDAEKFGAQGRAGSGATDAGAAAQSGAARTSRRGANTETKRSGRDTEAAMVPTGKAGRGSVVERRVRTDADEPEDTRAKRANPVEYFGQVFTELRKVLWPTKMQMLTYTAVVFIFLIFMTLLVSGVDFGAGKLVELTFGRS